MTNKTDAEILANAPDGAIGINMHGGYMYHAKGVRSLADIEALVAKDERIAELEKSMQEAVNYDCLPKFTQQRCVEALERGDV